MGLPNTVNQLFNGGSPYYIVNRSLRFRSSASAYLTRTPSVAGSQTTWTWSGWVKRGAFGINGTIFGAYTNSQTYYVLQIQNTEQLQHYNQTASSITAYLNTTQVFRDPSAWYHIVAVYNSTNATASNRMALYVNGVQVTAFSTATYPSQNTVATVNSTSAHDICRFGGASNYFDGYLAEVNFIDGQALTPSSFGAFDTNGIWQPIRYAGTYGTNGFYLPFSNTTSTTTLVADASGNGNNWTPNNISLTAGTTYDSMLDSPTVSNASSNYCVLNPLDLQNANTYSNANLSVSLAATTASLAFGTMGVSSGKWYWEVKTTSGANPMLGVATQAGTLSSRYFTGANSVYYYGNSGNKYVAGTGSAYGATYTTTDTIGIALDMDASTITYYKNSVSQGSISLPSSLIGQVVVPAFTSGTGTAAQGMDVNFGQRPFTYTAPSGYNALNTANLPAATINYGAPYMNAVTYTGYGPLIPSGLGIPTKSNASTQNVSKSLRFRNSATAYLSRSPASAGNQQKMTFSFWMKRGQLGVSRGIYCSGASGSGATQGGANITVGDTFTVNQQTNNAFDWVLTTTQVFRDPSAWYHIVVAIDTTQATSSNRVLIYVNGVQVTSFSASTYPTLNLSTKFNASGATNLGATIDAGAAYIPFDGYFAEVNFIDGQQLTPSSFGQTNSDGIWVPKSYTGTYGTNGFYLPFTNTTSTTTLVADSSGNGNNWTPNNISLTAGTTYDSMIDSPTDYASAGNYCVLNPLDKSSSITLSNGNLSYSSGTASNVAARATIGMTSGKWYWEGTNLVSGLVGIATSVASLSNYIGGDAYGWGYQGSNGQKYNSGAGAAYGATYNTTTDVIGVAFDADVGTLTFYKNGVSQGVAYTGLTSGPYFPAIGNGSNTSGVLNFGQTAFSYSAPSGYSALNTYNITAPSKTWFSSANNSGRGSATAYPDFVWIKSRSSAQNHSLNDTLRGPTLNLISNSTAAEAGASTMFSVNKYGLTLGNDASVNSSSYTDVMWGWQAGQGTTSTNTSGTITSTVSASAQSGFSIAIYTGTGANATVGHGLGVAPNMVIVKPRVVVDNWNVYHASNSASPATQVLYLNLTNATSTNATIWNNTAPTSSVFSIGTNTGINTNGSTYVAYCFAAVRGFSAFGSYTGNGSADGPFIYTGFRPRFVLLKDSSAAQNWRLFDSSRSTYNPDLETLFPNLTNAESTAETGPDFLSNGFKIRTSSATHNASGNTIIYAAFAESPFNISRAR